MIGSGPVMDFLGQTGLDAIKGTDILNIAPKNILLLLNMLTTLFLEN